jgi:hypothetical protein
MKYIVPLFRQNTGRVNLGAYHGRTDCLATKMLNRLRQEDDNDGDDFPGE